MIQEHLRRVASFTTAALLLTTGQGSAWAADVFTPDHIVVSRSIYAGVPGTVVVGQTLPPGCVAGTKTLHLIAGSTTTSASVACTTATNDGTFPNVFLNNLADGSFGVTSPVFLDHSSTSGAVLNSLAVDSTRIVTSLSSKSELGLNKSLDGNSITFMGYVTTPNQLDVSNANTPGVIDPTNPVGSQVYRGVAEVDALGNLTVTDSNAYSGNNGREAIKSDVSSYYTVGNDNNGGLTKTQLTTTTEGFNLVHSTGAEFLSPGQAPPVPPSFEEIGNYTISGDKPGKDTNFRGIAIHNNTLYITKGSGSNGKNTVYQVGTAGTLPTAANAAGIGGLFNEPIAVLPGFWNVLASDPTARYPFDIWFANDTTLYVADEGDGKTADAATDTKSGLEKWIFDGTNWNLAYTLQNGLNLGVQYTVATPPLQTAYPAVATDGLRHITGRVNTDGTVNLWGTTSTVSTSGDQGADPNQLVFVTDNLASPTAPASAQFTVLRTANYGEVLRGVSFAPGTILTAPASGSTCNGVYNGTFAGNLTVSAGQNCVFVGGSIQGNVQLTGGTLSLTNVDVTGNIEVMKGGNFSFGPSAAIGGNLEIHNMPASPAQNQVCDTRIAGTFEFHNNDASVQIGSASPICTGNTIGGDLLVHNNTGIATVDGNVVTGQLDDHNNSGATAVFSNTVGSTLTCKQNSSITGGGNTAATKEGQCSAF